MSTTAPSRTATRVRRARLAGLALTLACSPVAAVGLAAPAHAASTTGWLRLAHLSPDTPHVDIYLSPYAGGDPVVLHDVAYGDVSPYRSVPGGTYTATMRWAGANDNSTPVLTGNAQVTPGKAYTVAAVGLRKDLAAKVLSDDLTPPPADKGRVRLIQASTRADAVDVQAVGGPVLAQDAAFGTSSSYATVAPGRWTVKVTPRGGTAEPVTTTIDVPAGRISSVLVLDGAAQRSLTLKTTADSSGSKVVPKGGVQTGFGPRTEADSDSGPGPVGYAGLTALLLGGAAAGIRSRRPARHVGAHRRGDASA